MKVRFSIKYKLMLVLAVLSTVLVVSLTVVALRVAREALMERIESGLLHKAEDTAGLVDARIHATVEYINGVAQVPFLRDTAMSYAEKSVRISKEIDATCRPELLFISVVDLQGNLYHDGKPPVNLSSQAWFPVALRGETYITAPFASVLDGKLIFVIAIPVRGTQGEVLCILNVAIDGGWLVDQVRDIQIGTMGAVYVLDRDGHTVADPVPKLVLERFSSIEAAKADPKYASSGRFEQMAIRATETGVGFYEWGGVEKIAGYSKLPSTGWSVIIYAPLHEFLGPLRHLQLMIALVGSIVLALGLLGALVASRRMVRPILRITEVLEAVSRGDLQVEINRGAESNDEIGLLAASLARMLDKLKYMIREIRADAASLGEASAELRGSSQQLSSGANVQASSTEEIGALSEVTKSRAEEASGSLQSIVPKIEHTAELVQSVTRASLEQRTGVEQVNNAIVLLSDTAQQNASISEELSATSQEMAAKAERLQSLLDFFRS